nr:auxin efflux carrier [Cyrtomium guizhouense]
MISIKDLYTVLSSMVPLYVAMVLAYGSVRWWKIFTPVQCSGINRFVSVFAVPLLSFHFISTNDPYKMDGPFILADTLSKLTVLIVLAAWVKFSPNGSLDWMITLFAVATLPNTLVMGIPLLQAMYGTFYGGLMVQLVVLQCIIWYTLLLFLFEYRAATNLVMEQFPGVGASIVEFKVESDVVSLDGREPLQTQADIGEDGKIRVTIRKSTSSRPPSLNMFASPRRSLGMTSMPSSKAITPRPSNLTGVEVYSVYSSRNNTPREFRMNNPDLHSLMSTRPVSPRHSFTASDVHSGQSSQAPTPRASNVHEDNNKDAHPSSRGMHPLRFSTLGHGYGAKNYGANGTLNEPYGIGQNRPGHVNTGSWPGYSTGKSASFSPKASQISKKVLDSGGSPRLEDDGKELHMFVWSSTTSPVSEARTQLNKSIDSSKDIQEPKELRLHVRPSRAHTPNGADLHEPLNQPSYPLASNGGDDFSFASRAVYPEETGTPVDKGQQSASMSMTTPLSPKMPGVGKLREMPPTFVMMKLILKMVSRKLLRNPNTYSSLIGLVWALVSFRWNIPMPKMIYKSITILSDAGLGMAMFSLGLFMALQPRLIACGTSLASFSMAIRFLTGPAIMAAASIGVGLRGADLHAAIVQAALPQGIVPFVFAREYDLHPDILSTGVIFGMLVALPTTMLYYVLLGL